MSATPTPAPTPTPEPDRGPAHTAGVARRTAGTALAVLAVVEVAAALSVRLPSPTAGLATLMARLAPGPLATWFLQTFRGAARPLTLALAVVMLTGVGALVVRMAAPRTAAGADPTEAPADGAAPLGRRALFAGLGLGGALVLGAVMLARPGASGTHEALAAQLRAARRLPPLTPAQDVSAGTRGLSPTLTPVDDFYRIDTAFRVPTVELATWRLRISGRVREEVELDLDALVSLGLEEHDVTIACVSNLVGGDLVGTARWTGVPLARVLDLAGVRDDAEQVVGRSIDGWTAGFPVALASHPGTLVAIGMNGVPLPPRHGFPARLIVPGLYGYVSATKWLTDLELRGWDEFDAYWIRRGWSKEGPVKTMARIDVPGIAVDAGTVRVAGVAWAPDRGISAVEVRVDRGPWRAAVCSDPLGDAVWRQWWLDVELEPGDHEIQARAVDGAGAVQPEGPRDVLPDGAEGWHVRMVRVRAA